MASPQLKRLLARAAEHGIGPFRKPAPASTPQRKGRDYGDLFKTIADLTFRRKGLLPDKPVEILYADLPEDRSEMAVILPAPEGKFPVSFRFQREGMRYDVQIADPKTGKPGVKFRISDSYNEELPNWKNMGRSEAQFALYTIGQEFSIGQMIDFRDTFVDLRAAMPKSDAEFFDIKKDPEYIKLYQSPKASIEKPIRPQETHYESFPDQALRMHFIQGDPEPFMVSYAIRGTRYLVSLGVSIDAADPGKKTCHAGFCAYRPWTHTTAYEEYLHGIDSRGAYKSIDRSMNYDEIREMINRCRTELPDAHKAILEKYVPAMELCAETAALKELQSALQPGAAIRILGFGLIANNHQRPQFQTTMPKSTIGTLKP